MQSRQPIDMGYGISNGRMMRSQLRTIRRAADNMLNLTVDGDEVPGWLQAQVTISADKMKTSENYLQSQLELIRGKGKYGAAHFNESQDKNKYILFGILVALAVYSRRQY